MTEILLVLGLALVVIGPKKLPHLARALGRGLAELRRASDDLQRTIYQEVHKPLDPKELLRDLEGRGAQTKPGPPPRTDAGAPPPEAKTETGEEPAAPDAERDGEA